MYLPLIFVCSYAFRVYKLVWRLYYHGKSFILEVCCRLWGLSYYFCPNWQQSCCSFRWFQYPAQTYVKIPFFGAVPYLTLAVTPFCIVFAVVWAVKRQASYAWIGQDILVRIVILLSLYLLVKKNHRLLILLSIFLMTVIQGIALIITVLQIVRIPNLKVWFQSQP